MGAGRRDETDARPGPLGLHRALDAVGSGPSAAPQARRHFDAGAPLVIVSAPSSGADATFVVGVNDSEFDPERHRVVSNAVLHHQLPGTHGQGAR